jgi:hypothetical protein
LKIEGGATKDKAVLKRDKTALKMEGGLRREPRRP